ncbi:MAG: hypothetical protein ACLT76_06380 [Clostridium fessum]
MPERLHPLFPSAGTAVYAYTSVRGEASTEYLIDVAGYKRAAAGRRCRGCLGVRMRFFYVTDRCQLVAWGHMASRNRRTDVREADAPKALEDHASA